MKLAQAICFDLFHTLVDVGRVPESVGRFTADILGVGRKQWNDACFGPSHVIWQESDPFETLLQLAQSLVPDISHELVRQAVTERQARFDYALQHVEEHTLNALRNLRQQGLRLGLISNASSSEVQAWDDSPLAELFEVATFSCSCGYVKPDMAIYEHTLSALDVEARHSLFVGDGGSDEHFGAHKTGMKPILISRFLDHEEYQRRRDKYRDVLVGEISSLSELADMEGEG